MTVSFKASSLLSDSSSSSKLRSLFPDKDAVKIYPDDYYISDDGDNKRVSKDLTIPELLDRHSGHFSEKRVAILFRPGCYSNIACPVGYWTQVLGLGETPHDVVFQNTFENKDGHDRDDDGGGATRGGGGGVYALPANMENSNVGSLDTFWRSAENFTSDCCLPTLPPPSLDLMKNQNQPQQQHQDESFLSSWTLESASTSPSNPNDKGMMWAVSQAAPLRRVYVTHDLHLSLGPNYSSGGFAANCNVGGNLYFGTQQQFCVRNSEIGLKANGGAWNMVFVGCQSDCIDNVNYCEEGQEREDCNGDIEKEGTSESNTGVPKINWDGRPPNMVTSEPTTKQQIEKPYIFISQEDDDQEVVYLAIPKLKTNTNGIDFNEKLTDDEKVVIDNKDKVRVIDKWTPFQVVQDCVDNGTHLVLSPGIYHWNQTLHIRKSDLAVLGLGLATIQSPGDGTPCIQVSQSACGVRLSGLAFEASVISKFIYKGSTLLQWGDQYSLEDITNGTIGDGTNPSIMHDIYCFVGGRNLNRTVKVECMIKIYSDNVIGDNLWLWRADHVQVMTNESPNKPELSEYHVTILGECCCDTGLEVHGDNVTMIGLAVEHTYKDMVSWYGRNGSVYFYQSELPYDVIGECGGNKGSSTSLAAGTYSKSIAGYRVNSCADGHIAKGVGVYSYFRDCPNITIDSAIVDHALSSQFVNCFTVWLNGYSGIKSVINGQGGVTKMPGQTVEVPSYQSSLWSRYVWIGLIPWWWNDSDTGKKVLQHVFFKSWAYFFNRLIRWKGKLLQGQHVSSTAKASTRLPKEV